FFARLPKRSCLVLDNVQEVIGESAFERILLAAFEEVPEGLRVIALSRSIVPLYLTRLLANRAVQVLPAEHLTLTLEESFLIAQTQVKLTDAAARLLHELAAGWMAGLVLLVEYVRRGGKLEQAEVLGGLDEVFSYFATQLFDDAPADTQRVLLQL